MMIVTKYLKFYLFISIFLLGCSSEDGQRPSNSDSSIQSDLYVAGLDAAMSDAIYPDVSVFADMITEKTSPGPLIGQVATTYYWLALESNFTASNDVAIYDENCKKIDVVSTDFADALCLEKAGKLEDGRVVDYARKCSCGRPCPSGSIVCYQVIDDEKFPWGVGEQNQPLIPLRSIAVEASYLSFGKRIYISLFDGMYIPRKEGVGGFFHDGCFQVDDFNDVGAQIHIYTGNHAIAEELELSIPSMNKTEIREGGSHCADSF